MKKQDKIYVMKFEGRVHGGAENVTLWVFDSEKDADDHIKAKTDKQSKYWTLFKKVQIGQQIEFPSLSRHDDGTLWIQGDWDDPNDI